MVPQQQIDMLELHCELSVCNIGRRARRKEIRLKKDSFSFTLQFFRTSEM